MALSRRILSALFFLAAIGAILLWTSLALGNPAPPISRTGAPGDNGSCYASGCHATAPENQGGGSISIVTNLTEYDAGDEVNVTVTVEAGPTNPGMDRFGFEIIVLDENNAFVGAWSTVGNTGLAQNQTDDETRTYVNTNDAGTGNGTDRSNMTWSFTWRALDHYGDVTYYVAGAATDTSVLPNFTRHAYVTTFILNGTNRAPTLTNPIVEPPGGGEAQTFNFTVTFTDIDGDEPGYVRLFIDNGTLVRNMSAAGSDSTKDGRQYFVEVAGTDIGVAANHTFYFGANDTEGANATGEATNLTDGPIINDPPEISNPGVSPTGGGRTTLFNFTVTYTDVNAGQLPDHVDVVINDQHVAMSKVDPGDNDYTDGVDYYYTTRQMDGGSPLNAGWNSYQFNVSDGVETVLSSVGSLLVNDLPSLANPSVSPSSGGQATTFNFTVEYTDINNQAGNVSMPLYRSTDGGNTYTFYVRYYLNRTGGGSGTLYDGDYTNGEQYYYATTLPWGDYAYFFTPWDGYQFGANTSFQYAPSVNDAPVLADGDATPISGGESDNYTFTVNLTDANGGQTVEVWVTITGVASYAMADSGGGTYTYTANGLPWGLRTYNFSARDQMGAAATGDVLLHPALTVNDAPLLANGGVTPSSGGEGTTFTFNVTLTDPNSGQPLTAYVNLSGVGTFVMVDSGGGNYVYATSSLTWGSYPYTFEASDSLGTNATGDTGVHPAVVVSDAPSLSGGGATPLAGSESGAYTFYVNYTDPNAGQNASVQVNLTGIGTFNLTSTDTDYTDGANFTVTLSGTTLGAGVHAFTFYAQDEQGDTAYLDPDLSVRVNDAPSLSGGSVVPAQGLLGSNFNFSVTYTDANGGQTPTVWLWLDGTTNYTLAEVDPGDTDTSDGKAYFVEVAVGLGDHSFYFGAHDSMDVARDPGSGTFDGPEVATSRAELHVSALKYYRADGAEVGGSTGKSAIKWEDTTLQLQVANTGGLTALNFNVSVTVNDVLVNETSYALSPGATQTIQFTYNFTSVGTSYVNVSVDPANTTFESDETNNLYNDTLAVKDFLTSAAFTFTGQVTYPNGTAANASYVNITNQRTGGVASLTTDANGNYTYVLNDGANLTYNEGDFFLLVAEWTIYTDTETVRVYSEDGGATVNFVVGRQAGLTLTNLSSDDVSSLPGRTVQYTVNLTNQGNFDDTFDLSLSSDQGWSVRVLNGSTPVDNVSLVEGGWVVLTVELTLPAAEPANTQDQVNLTAISRFDAATNASLLLNLTVLQYAGVTVTPPTGNLTLPGVEVYQFTLTNTGNGDDVFNLTTTSGWDTAIKVGGVNVTEVAIARGGSVTVTVELTVPAVRNNTQDLLTLTATSQFNTSVADSDSLTTTVDRFAGVTVTIVAPTTQTELAGTQVTFTFNVTNTGNEDDTFNLSASADAAWSASVQTTVAIPYGGWALIEVTVTVPDERFGNSTGVDLDATSQFDNGATASDSGTGVVDRYAGVTVTAEAPTSQTALAGTELTYTFNVTNSGNEDDTFNLSASADPGWSVDPLDPVAIPYGGWALVEVTVTVPDSQSGTTTTVTLTATSQFDADAAGSDAVTSTVALYAGGTLDQPGDGAGQPGDTLTYTFTLTNTGNDDDTFDLSATSLGGWQVAYPNTTSLAVAYRGAITFQVQVTVERIPAGLTDVLRVTVTSTNDNSQATTSAVTSTVLQLSQATLQAPDDRNVTPELPLFITFYLVNEGNGQDTFDLAYTSSGGITYTLSASQVTLNSPGQAAITLSLTSFPKLASSTGEVVTLYANSTLGPSYSDSTLLTVATVGGIFVTAPAPASGVPGEVIALEFVLENDGNDADAFDLTVGTGWDYTLSESDNQLDVAYLANGSVWVNVTVPSFALAGSTTTVTLYASSTNQPGILDSDQVVLTVSPTAGVTVRAPADSRGEPGGEVSYSFQIINDGNSADTFDLQYSVPANWQSNGPATTNQLQPGLSQFITVTVTLPAIAQAPAGSTGDLLVTAISQTNPTRLDSDSVTTTVLQVYGVTLDDGGGLDTTSLVPGTPQPYTLTVTNTGNGQDTLQLQLSGAAASWALLSTSSVTLGAGSSTSVSLTVTIPELTPEDQAGLALTVRAVTHQASTEKSYTVDLSASAYQPVQASFATNQVDLNPGTSGTYTLQLQNNGQATTQYQVQLLDSPAGWLVSFDSVTLEVTAGSSSPVRVQVSVPLSWNTSTPRTVTILVVDLMNSDAANPALQVTVNQPPDTSAFVLQTNPSTVQSGQAAAFAVAALANSTYTWNMGDGSAPLVGPNEISHTYSRSGTYLVTLTVTDNRTGLSQTFEISVTVANQPPEKPPEPVIDGRLRAGQKYTVVEDQVVNLTFSLSKLLVLDPDGDITALVVDWGDEKDPEVEIIPLSQNSDEIITVSHAYSQPGNYDIKASLQDNQGETGATYVQSVLVSEQLIGLNTSESIVGFIMVLGLLVLGVLMVAATQHRRKQPRASSMNIPPGFIPAPGPDAMAQGQAPAFLPSGPAELSEEDRARMEELERRMERLMEKEELMEVASYDASRVTTILEEHLRKFDEIIIRAQELAAKERLEQLQRELEEQEERQKDDELAESEPDIERLSLAFTETLHRLVKTRDELSGIEAQLTNILKQERDEYEMELERVSQTYEETKRKIRALEELADMRAQSQDEQTLMDLLTSEEPVTDYEPETFADEYADEEEYLDEEYTEEYEEEEETAECGNCGADIPADAMECPSCGVTFEEEEEEEEYEE